VGERGAKEAKVVVVQTLIIIQVPVQEMEMICQV
jgi:hypothetical protein